MKYQLYETIKDVLSIYRSKHKTGDEEEIRRAFEFASEVHADMKRGTGEPFINHPLRVAKLVAEWGFEGDVIMAALLHDTVEECGVPINEIKTRFNQNVASLIRSIVRMSDKDFVDKPSKAQMRLISDEKLKKEMQEKALYVKIAERIDNLSTLSGIGKDAGMLMAKHTRLIVIPMVRLEHAYHFVDMLEDLCFQAEHPALYEDLTARYEDLLSVNRNTLSDSLNTLRSIFDPRQKCDDPDLESYHDYIVDFKNDKRSCISIYRQISHDAGNFTEEWRDLLSKENIPLYDLTLIVSDELSEEKTAYQPNDIFCKHFERALAGRGFYLLRHGYTTYHDADYFLIADEMDNLYRLFVRTEKDYMLYSYGDILEKDSTLFLSEKKSAREDTADKIKVFRKDGSAIYIDKGATVLDFAFLIHSDLGLHFEYALMNESETRHDKHTRLSDGDWVTIVASKSVEPNPSWFKSAKTTHAVNSLVNYFSKKENLSKLL